MLASEIVCPPGAVATTKLTPFEAMLFTVTITLPVAAPLGTGTTMLVVLQLVGVAVVPPKVTVLDPCVDPKFDPFMVIEVPTNPDTGLRLEMAGPVGVVPVIVNVI